MRLFVLFISIFFSVLTTEFSAILQVGCLYFYLDSLEFRSFETKSTDFNCKTFLFRTSKTRKPSSETYFVITNTIEIAQLPRLVCEGILLDVVAGRGVARSLITWLRTRARSTTWRT